MSQYRIERYAHGWIAIDTAQVSVALNAVFDTRDEAVLAACFETARKEAVLLRTTLR
jgi:hypothetical protein